MLSFEFNFLFIKSAVGEIPVVPWIYNIFHGCTLWCISVRKQKRI